MADPCTLSTTEVVSSTFSTEAHGPNATEDSYVYIKMRCNGDGTNGNDGFTTLRQDTLNTFA